MSSPASPDRTSAALREATSKVKWFGDVDTPFVGTTSSDRFAIQRVVRNRNSFNPMLFGRLEPGPDGTRIKVVMTLHPASWIFLALWSVVIGYCAVAYPAGRWSTLSAIGFIWIVASVVFFRGIGASKALLARTVHGRERRPAP
jgi:hypothetical protein